MQQAEAKKFAENQLAAAQAQAASKASAPKSSGASSNEGPLSEEGLTPGHIDMVMDHTSCTRNEAIKALRESNNDMINAVMKLTN